MPAAEVTVTTEQLRSMIVRQAPQLAHEPIEFLANGWDNALFRIGRDHVARLPRRRAAVALVEHELRWLATLAPRLPLAIPVPELAGLPSDGYPWPWSIVPWIEGTPLAASVDVDVDATARSLGEFLAALHRPAPAEAPVNPVRGVPLARRATATEERLRALRGRADVDRIESLWAELRDTPTFERPPVWLHGDLHPANVLVSDGIPCGVIDWGDVTSGDPATDLSIAWIAFADASARATLLTAYGGVDDETGRRARGWALSLATAYVAHGADNPTMTSIGDRALRHVLAD